MAGVSDDAMGCVPVAIRRKGYRSVFRVVVLSSWYYQCFSMLCRLMIMFAVAVAATLKLAVER